MSGGRGTEATVLLELFIAICVQNLFYQFYLCSFSNLGGRGTEATVLLELFVFKYHWEYWAKPLRTLGKTIENIRWNHWEHWAKPLKKSPETLQKVISHRPFSMFITVGMNTSIDRSPCSQRSVWDDFLKGFRRHIAWVLAIFCHKTRY